MLQYDRSFKGMILQYGRSKACFLAIFGFLYTAPHATSKISKKVWEWWSFNTIDRLGRDVSQYGRSSRKGGTSHLVQINNNFSITEEIIEIFFVEKCIKNNPLKIR